MTAELISNVLFAMIGIFIFINAWFLPERTQRIIARGYKSLPDGYPFRRLSIDAAENGCMIWVLRLCSIPLIIFALSELVPLLHL